MASLLGRRNATQSSISNGIVLVSLLAISLFIGCDARSSLEVFNLRKGLKFSYPQESNADSLDLTTLDAFDFGFSPPFGPLDNSFLGPSPLAKPPISSPQGISPSPSPSPTSQISHPPDRQPSPAQSDLFGPHSGPTQYPQPSMRPAGAPLHSWAPDYAVWCVARPTVPEPVIQKAMDYACGNGADCKPVRPNGPCFVPNTLVAHASYAFNSYWQRTKILGGTCDFGGTAMLITVDPNARSSLEVFNLRKGLKFSYPQESDVESMDLPTPDAYDFGFSPPFGPLDNSFLGPSPLAKPPISSPQQISPSPSPSPSSSPTSQISHLPDIQPGPAQSDLFGPHNGPTQYPQPSLRPAGAPGHSWAPDYAVWCVARPTVPEPVIQKAMDYACGNGADCKPVRPNGPCFVPNTLVAHASYAFNSYWQRTKILGGTCDFGGTAMLITVDPSFSACHFMYM